MYNKIIDPVSLKSVDIKSIYGKNIIKLYIRNLLCGGSGKGVSDKKKKKQEIKKMKAVTKAQTEEVEKKKIGPKYRLQKLKNYY